MRLIWNAVEGQEGAEAVTLVGTTTPAPYGTTWVFTDPTPVWRCFAGIKTHGFELGTFTASKPILLLYLGDPPSCGIGFDTDAGQACIGSPKHYSEGGYWEFDAKLQERLCQLLSSTPPTKIATPRR